MPLWNIPAQIASCYCKRRTEDTGPSHNRSIGVGAAIMSIIYLHGFNSSGQSAKAQELAARLPDIEVLAPDIPADMRQAIPFLMQYIGNHADGELMLIGSSLGGYYARYLAGQFGCAAVLINPALEPVPLLLRQLGEQVNYYTGLRYDLTADMVHALAAYARTDTNPPLLVLLDAEDELLDSGLTQQLCRGMAEIVAFPGGSHRFEHLPESINRIRSFYQQNKAL